MQKQDGFGCCRGLTSYPYLSYNLKFLVGLIEEIIYPGVTQEHTRSLDNGSSGAQHSQLNPTPHPLILTVHSLGFSIYEVQKQENMSHNLKNMA